MPAATELLTWLKRHGPRFAIATSSMPGQIGASVAALHLPSPPTITDGSNVAHAKPEPDLLLVAALQLGVEPRDCWYVGDSTWDMIAAKAAGMIGIGVATGAVGREGLLAAGAMVALDDLRPLLAELDRRFPKP